MLCVTHTFEEPFYISLVTHTHTCRIILLLMVLEGMLKRNNFFWTLRNCEEIFCFNNTAAAAYRAIWPDKSSQFTPAAVAIICDNLYSENSFPSPFFSSILRVCRCLSLFNKCNVMISISIIYMGILSPSILYTTMFCWLLWQCLVQEYNFFYCLWISAILSTKIILFRWKIMRKSSYAITSRKILSSRSVRKKKISDLLQFDLSSTFVSEYDKFSSKFFSFFLSTRSWCYQYVRIIFLLFSF